MSSEPPMEIVEAIVHGPVNPIAKVLQGKKNSNKTVLDVLVKACHCTMNKKHGYITDQAGNIIKISQLFEYLGVVTTGGVRCPKCSEPVSYDLLLYHFDDHGFKIEKICDLFKRKFDQWEHSGSKIRYLGSDVKV